jgi:pimeloyl-ACP methyl ester carboxylesterase
MVRTLILWLALSLAVNGLSAQVIDRVVCKDDPGQSYALYIPARGNSGPLPVIYCFDSHGIGSLPVRKYKALADAFGFILAGSNNSKNGNDWTTTEKIWEALYRDTQKRLKLNASRVYTCGFSGGAKVAGYIAIQHSQVKGVIANGAGLPDGVSAGDLSFSFTAIAGEGDMNMTDLVAFDEELGRTRTRHRLLLFEGIHEWAPEPTMRIAFQGLQLDAMQAGLIPRSAAVIDAYSARSKAAVRALTGAGQWIKGREACSVAISYLQGISGEVAWFTGQAAAIDGNVVYRKQEEDYRRLLAIEQNTKAGFMQVFQQGNRDMDWWRRSIDNRRKRAAAKTDEGAMNQRLLAYLSLAFYSISNQLINSGQDAQARHYVELYEMADPTNSEAWYFLAVLDAREGNGHAATEDLLKAAGYGFRDRDRLRKQPEFRRLSGSIDLSQIERKMH